MTNQAERAGNTVPAALYVAWTTALLATLASIYFIEILHKPAATLCWIERMLMFGLFLLLTIGILDHDMRVKRYALPFLIIGLPLSLYQQLVHWNVIHISPTACSVSVVCTTKYFNLFGFITQATLCFAAFLVIAISLSRINNRHNDVSS